MRPITVVVTVSLAIGVAGFVLSLACLTDTGTVSRLITGGGFLLTAASLAAALAIFDRQGRQAEKDRRELNDELATLRDLSGELREQADRHGELLGQLNDKVDAFLPEEVHRVANDQAAAQGDEGATSETEAKGAVPPDVLVSMGVSAQDSSRVAAYAGKNIPMRPLSALYAHLTSATTPRDVEGGAEYLSPDEMFGYRVRGKGPHFWYISTPDAPGSGRSPEGRRTRTLWRISHTGVVTPV